MFIGISRYLLPFQSSFHWGFYGRISANGLFMLTFNPLFIEARQSGNLLQQVMQLLSILFSLRPVANANIQVIVNNPFNPLFIEALRYREGFSRWHNIFQSSFHWGSGQRWCLNADRNRTFNPLFIEAKEYTLERWMTPVTFNPLFIEARSTCFSRTNIGESTFNPLFIEAQDWLQSWWCKPYIFQSSFHWGYPCGVVV